MILINSTTAINPKYVVSVEKVKRRDYTQKDVLKYTTNVEVTLLKFNYEEFNHGVGTYSETYFSELSFEETLNVLGGAKHSVVRDGRLCAV